MILTKYIKQFSIYSALLTFCTTPFYLNGFILWCIFSKRWKKLGGMRLNHLLLGLYCIWIYFDKRVAVQGGRYPYLKKFFPWHLLRKYFPAKVVQTSPLDPNKRYIFGCHPHGIFSLSTSINLATTDLSVQIRPVTISLNFVIPGWREFVMGMGMVDMRRDSCVKVLENGDSLAIVIGGAAESLDARPHTNDLILHSRKGFIRLALQNGAALVPVFTFGETNLYKQLAANPRGSILRTIQDWLREKLTFALPLFYGKSFLPIPFPHPLTTVIGTPIEVERVENPSREQIDSLHESYMQSLQQLYDDYKDVYDHDRKSEMRFVDANQKHLLQAKL